MKKINTEIPIKKTCSKYKLLRYCSKLAPYWKWLDLYVFCFAINMALTKLGWFQNQIFSEIFTQPSNKKKIKFAARLTDFYGKSIEICLIIRNFQEIGEKIILPFCIEIRTPKHLRFIKRLYKNPNKFFLRTNTFSTILVMSAFHKCIIKCTFVTINHWNRKNQPPCRDSNPGPSV